MSEKMVIAPPLPAPSPEHLAQLDAARQATKKIRRAVAVANVDGWSIAAIAAMTIVFSFTSPPELVLGLGMTYVAWRELSSGAALKKLDTGAPRRLANNQVVLSAMLILYFGWSLYRALTQPSEISEILGSNLDTAQMFGGIDQFSRAISIWMYVGLILLSILFPGLTSLYYSSRAKPLQEYLTKTPQWIIDYQRGGGTL